MRHVMTSNATSLQPELAMTHSILLPKMPQTPWMQPETWRLPGVQPLALEGWLVRDEAFAGQMALRDKLIAERTDLVHALRPEARLAAEECLDLALSALRSDREYTFSERQVRRPDTTTIPLDHTNPLVTLGRLVQADICLMQPSENGHVLTGAILCFPEHWTLSEKIGHPLVRIHQPVSTYNSDVAQRVQRLFDAISPDRLLWRSNAFMRQCPDLFTPLREGDTRNAYPREDARYIRTERQTFRKLPVSGAVVFAIHTSIVPIEMLSEDERTALDQADVKHI